MMRINLTLLKSRSIIRDNYIINCRHLCTVHYLTNSLALVVTPGLLMVLAALSMSNIQAFIIKMASYIYFTLVNIMRNSGGYLEGRT